MTEAGVIDSRIVRAGPVRIIRKDFQGRPVLTPAGQQKMHTTDMYSGNTGKLVDPCAGEIAFRRNGPALQDIDIELGQFFPIFCNEVSMDVSYFRTSLR